MMTCLTRREFLELAATRSVVASIAANALLSGCRSTADRRSALGLDANETKTLIALIDEIIPAAEGMPAASEAGTLAYFELLSATEPSLGEMVRAVVRRADDLSRGRTQKILFLAAPGERRVIASALAQSDEARFAGIRDYVYEGYYLQPRVWAAMGYEPYPTHSGGPEMTPFDSALLNRVRAMTIRYRKA